MEVVVPGERRGAVPVEDAESVAVLMDVPVALLDEPVPVELDVDEPILLLVLDTVILLEPVPAVVAWVKDAVALVGCAELDGASMDSGTARSSARLSLPRMTITCASSDNRRVTSSEATLGLGSATTAVTNTNGEPPVCWDGTMFTDARCVLVARYAA